MTEAEWLACTDPGKMVACLSKETHDRKLRLFGCACCRQVWQWITEEVFRTAVETAERFADGKASNKDLATAKRAGGAALASNSGSSNVFTHRAGSAAWSTTCNAPMAAMYPLWVYTDEADKEWQPRMPGLCRQVSPRARSPAVCCPGCR